MRDLGLTSQFKLFQVSLMSINMTIVVYHDLINFLTYDWFQQIIDKSNVKKILPSCDLVTLRKMINESKMINQFL